jgi:hypothetical protein
MPPNEPGSLLRDDAALGIAALAFNLVPAAYAHPQRLANEEASSGLPAATWRRLLACERLAGRLSQRLLARLDAAGPPCWDFGPPLRRLALLPSSELARVARFVGAYLHAGAVRSVIARTPLMALRAAIGEDAYAFAVKRAPFLKAPPPRPRPPDIVEAVLRDGERCLAGWLEGEPRSVAERVRLRFPPGGGLDAPDPQLGGETARTILTTVLRAGDPAWRACCG